MKNVSIQLETTAVPSTADNAVSVTVSINDGTSTAQTVPISASMAALAFVVADGSWIATAQNIDAAGNAVGTPITAPVDATSPTVLQVSGMTVTVTAAP